MEKYYCWNKNCEKEIPEPEDCCSGKDCGCIGMPIDPPFCSDRCQEEWKEQQKQYLKQKNSGCKI